MNKLPQRYIDLEEITSLLADRAEVAEMRAKDAAEARNSMLNTYWNGWCDAIDLIANHIAGVPSLVRSPRDSLD